MLMLIKTACPYCLLDGYERERMFDVMLERFACEYQQGNGQTGKTTTVAGEKFQKKATREMELRTIGRVLFCHDSKLDTHTVSSLCGSNIRFISRLQRT